ncbi:hypothetical protein [Mycobacteroides abscessus]|uniref:hypothetical protein n=1 Tax=Mycobacteroides abscessus TaxID=36809 RepID=UPI0013FD0678|nr:hypothetical protein [Mycobacteroides abscessus]
MNPELAERIPSPKDDAGEAEDPELDGMVGDDPPPLPRPEGIEDFAPPRPLCRLDA